MIVAAKEKPQAGPPCTLANQAYRRIGADILCLSGFCSDCGSARILKFRHVLARPENPQSISWRGMFDRLYSRISAMILRYLSQPTARYAPFFSPPLEVLGSAAARRYPRHRGQYAAERHHQIPHAIDLVARLSLCRRTAVDATGGEPNVLLEAEVDTGVSLVPLSKYAQFNTRICRPVGLDAPAGSA